MEYLGSIITIALILLGCVGIVRKVIKECRELIQTYIKAYEDQKITKEEEKLIMKEFMEFAESLGKLFFKLFSANWKKKGSIADVKEKLRKQK